MTIFAEGTDPTLQLLPEGPELVFGFISFAIVFIFLAKWVFPRINTMLEERAEKIQGKIDEADRTMLEAIESQNEYKDRLKEAHLEANKIVEQARNDAESQRENIIRKAQQEAEKIRDDAHRAADEEHQRLLHDARNEISDLAISLASRIVQREIDAERHNEIVNDFISSLGNTK